MNFNLVPKMSDHKPGPSGMQKMSSDCKNGNLLLAGNRKKNRNAVPMNATVIRNMRKT